MSKQYGWTTILHVNGGEVYLDMDALKRMRDPLGYVRGEAEKILVAA